MQLTLWRDILSHSPPPPPQGVEVCGKPSMTAFSIRSKDPKLSIFAIADEMEKQGQCRVG